MWLYGSGFPKSMNIGLAIDKKNNVESKVIGIGKSGSPETHNNSLNIATDYKNGIYEFGGEYEIKEARNEWKGWGTCLKPSFEPIIMARKPFKGSLVDNVIQYGVGGINIDECRVGKGTGNEKPKYEPNNKNNIYGKGLGGGKYENTNGRFPANTILTYDETDEEEVCGGFPDTKGNGNIRHNNNNDKNYNCYSNYGDCETRGYDDSGSVARYFYCAKASAKDRDEGLDRFEEKEVRVLNATNPELEKKDDVSSRFITVKKNTHPTVKPTELMQYLVRLVTPRGGTILDPFNGSGSTGKAVAFENRERDANYKYIGIELDKYYCDISKARIQWASVEYVYTDDENVTEELVSDLKSNINKSKGIRLW